MTVHDHAQLPDPSTVDIRGLLPQQPPFVMVGRLVYADGPTTVSHTLITDDCIMVDDGYLSAMGIIENMAQTCAARIGYVNRYVAAREVRVGFIGAIRDLHIHSLPAAGSTLVTEVTVVDEVFGMTLVEARSHADGHPVATGTMKIALAPAPDGGSASDKA